MAPFSVDISLIWRPVSRAWLLGAGRRATAFFVALVTALSSALAPAAQAEFWAERSAGRRPIVAADQIAAALPIADPVVSALSRSSATGLRPVATLPFQVNAGALPARCRGSLTALAASGLSIRRVRLPDHGPARALAFHILDVHQNAEAQRLIADGARRLIEAGAVDRIGVEGAFGPVALEPFRGYAHSTAARRLADFLFRSGRISGAVYAALTASRPAALVGIDDRAAHAANAAAARRAWSERERRLAAIDAEERVVAAAGAAANGLPLRALDAAVAAYKSGRGSFAAYLSAINAVAPSTDPNVAAFLDALARERRMDWKRVEAERSAFLARLWPRLAPSEERRLVDAALAVRAGAQSAGAFLMQLQTAGRRAGVSMAELPALRDYLSYAATADRIDPAALLAEADRLEETAYARLADTDEKRHWAERARRLRILRRLVDFSLTASEWRQNGSWLESEEARTLAPFLDFYRCAVRRDALMAGRALSLVQPDATIVLVTGGFHADRIQAALLESGVAVVELVPPVSRVDRGQTVEALGLFAREKTPLDRLFAGEKVFLAPLAAPTVDAMALGVAAVEVADGTAGSPEDAQRVLRAVGGDATVTGISRGNGAGTVKTPEEDVEAAVEESGGPVRDVSVEPPAKGVAALGRRARQWVRERMDRLIPKRLPREKPEPITSSFEGRSWASALRDPAMRERALAELAPAIDQLSAIIALHSSGVAALGNIAYGSRQPDALRTMARAALDRFIENRTPDEILSLISTFLASYQDVLSGNADPHLPSEVGVWQSLILHMAERTFSRPVPEALETLLAYRAAGESHPAFADKESPTVIAGWLTALLVQRGLHWRFAWGERCSLLPTVRDERVSREQTLARQKFDRPNYAVQAAREDGASLSTYVQHDGAYYVLSRFSFWRRPLIVNVDPHADTQDAPEVTPATWARHALQDGLAGAYLQASPQADGTFVYVLWRRHWWNPTRLRARTIKEAEAAARLRGRPVFLTVDADAFSLKDFSGAGGRVYHLAPDAFDARFAPIRRLFETAGVRPFHVNLSISPSYIGPPLRSRWVVRWTTWMTAEAGRLSRIRRPNMAVPATESLLLLFLLVLARSQPAVAALVDVVAGRPSSPIVFYGAGVVLALALVAAHFPYDAIVDRFRARRGLSPIERRRRPVSMLRGALFAHNAGFAVAGVAALALPSFLPPQAARLAMLILYAVAHAIAHVSWNRVLSPPGGELAMPPDFPRYARVFKGDKAIDEWMKRDVPTTSLRKYSGVVIRGLVFDRESTLTIGDESWGRFGQLSGAPAEVDVEKGFPVRVRAWNGSRWIPFELSRVQTRRGRWEMTFYSPMSADRFAALKDSVVYSWADKSGAVVNGGRTWFQQADWAGAAVAYDVKDGLVRQIRRLDADGRLAETITFSEIVNGGGAVVDVFHGDLQPSELAAMSGVTLKGGRFDGEGNLTLAGRTWWVAGKDWRGASAEVDVENGVIVRIRAAKGAKSATFDMSFIENGGAPDVFQTMSRDRLWSLDRVTLRGPAVRIEGGSLKVGDQPVAPARDWPDGPVAVRFEKGRPARVDFLEGARALRSVRYLQVFDRDGRLLEIQQPGADGTIPYRLAKRKDAVRIEGVRLGDNGELTAGAEPVLRFPDHGHHEVELEVAGGRVQFGRVTGDPAGHPYQHRRYFGQKVHAFLPKQTAFRDRLAARLRGFSIEPELAASAAETLVRLRGGSLEVLRGGGLLEEREVDALIRGAFDELDLESLVRRLAHQIRSYPEAARQSGFVRHLVASHLFPWKTVQALQRKYRLGRSLGLLNEALGHPNVDAWLRVRRDTVLKRGTLDPKNQVRYSLTQRGRSPAEILSYFESVQRVLNALVNGPATETFLSVGRRGRELAIQLTDGTVPLPEPGDEIVLGASGRRFTVLRYDADRPNVILLAEVGARRGDLPAGGRLRRVDPQMARQLDLLNGILGSLRSTQGRTTGNRPLDRLLGLLPLSLPTGRTVNHFFDDRIPFFRDAGSGVSHGDEAIQAAVNMAMDAPEVLYILGPAATGKTTTIVEIIRQLVLAGKKGILISQMHQAVDNALDDLVDVKGLAALRLTGSERNIAYPRVRALWPGSRREEVRPYVLHEFDRRRRRGSGGFVIGLTNSATDTEPLLSDETVSEAIGDGVDFVIMDEASREHLAGAVVPLLKTRGGRPLVKPNAKIILVGDNRQLPPFGLTHEQERLLLATPSGVSQSDIDLFNLGFFDWLLERPYGETIMLSTNYRQPSILARLTSELFYDGEVHTRDFEDYDAGTLSFHLAETRFGREERDGSSFRNFNSAAITMSRLRRHLYDPVHPVPPNKITIIAPYLAQVDLLKDLVRQEMRSRFPRLREPDYPMVTTIDAFQGGENDVILLDFVRSNAQREIGFARDLRRLNVAFSRASRILEIIWDSRTFTGQPVPGEPPADATARAVFRKLQSFYEREVVAYFGPTPGASGVWTFLERFGVPREAVIVLGGVLESLIAGGAAWASGGAAPVLYGLWVAAAFAHAAGGVFVRAPDGTWTVRRAWDGRGPPLTWRSLIARNVIANAVFASSLGGFALAASGYSAAWIILAALAPHVMINTVIAMSRRPRPGFSDISEDQIADAVFPSDDAFNAWVRAAASDSNASASSGLPTSRILEVVEADRDAVGRRVAAAFRPALEARAAALGESFGAYLAALESGVDRAFVDGLLRRSAEADVTPATTFFRNDDQWDVAGFLDETLAAKWDSGDLRIRSRHVSASNGAEAYSVGMYVDAALRRLYARLRAVGTPLPDYETWARRWDVRIDAFDLSGGNLLRAALGRYTTSSKFDRAVAQRFPRNMRASFFSEDRFELQFSDRLRAWVRPVFTDLSDPLLQPVIAQEPYDLSFSLYTLQYVSAQDRARIAALLKRTSASRSLTVVGDVNHAVISRRSGSVSKGAHYAEQRSRYVTDVVQLLTEEDPGVGRVALAETALAILSLFPEPLEPALRAAIDGLGEPALSAAASRLDRARRVNGASLFRMLGARSIVLALALAPAALAAQPGAPAAGGARGFALQPPASTRYPEFGSRPGLASEARSLLDRAEATIGPRRDQLLEEAFRSAIDLPNGRERNQLLDDIIRALVRDRRFARARRAAAFQTPPAAEASDRFIDAAERVRALSPAPLDVFLEAFDRAFALGDRAAASAALAAARAELNAPAAGLRPPPGVAPDTARDGAVVEVARRALAFGDPADALGLLREVSDPTRFDARALTAEAESALARAESDARLQRWWAGGLAAAFVAVLAVGLPLLLRIRRDGALLTAAGELASAKRTVWRRASRRLFRGLSRLVRRRALERGRVSPATLLTILDRLSRADPGRRADEVDRRERVEALARLVALFAPSAPAAAPIGFVYALKMADRLEVLEGLVRLHRRLSAYGVTGPARDAIRESALETAGFDPALRDAVGRYLEEADRQNLGYGDRAMWSLQNDDARLLNLLLGDIDRNLPPGFRIDPDDRGDFRVVATETLPPAVADGSLLLHERFPAAARPPIRTPGEEATLTIDRFARPDAALDTAALYLDSPQTHARGRVIRFDLEDVEARQVLETGVRERDFYDRPIGLGDQSAGLSLSDIVNIQTGVEAVEARRERRPARTPLLVAGASNGDFLRPNAVAIVDGKLVTRERSRRGVDQTRWQPPHGRFWILSLDWHRPGVFPIEVDEGRLVGTAPVQNGFAGPLLVKDGVSVFDPPLSANPEYRMSFGRHPALAGNDVPYDDADARMALSAYGFDGDGRLVFVQLSGDRSSDRPEASVRQLAETMIALGVKEAVLGSDRSAVQSFVAGREGRDEWRFAEDVGIQVSDRWTRLGLFGVQNVRPLGHALAVFPVRREPGGESGVASGAWGIWARLGRWGLSPTAIAIAGGAIESFLAGTVAHATGGAVGAATGLIAINAVLHALFGTLSVSADGRAVARPMFRRAGGRWTIDAGALPGQARANVIALTSLLPFFWTDASRWLIPAIAWASALHVPLNAIGARQAATRAASAADVSLSDLFTDLPPTLDLGLQTWNPVPSGEAATPEAAVIEVVSPDDADRAAHWAGGLPAGVVPVFTARSGRTGAALRARLPKAIVVSAGAAPDLSRVLEQAAAARPAGPVAAALLAGRLSVRLLMASADWSFSPTLVVAGRPVPAAVLSVKLYALDRVTGVLRAIDESGDLAAGLAKIAERLRRVRGAA